MQIVYVEIKHKKATICSLDKTANANIKVQSVYSFVLWYK